MSAPCKLTFYDDDKKVLGVYDSNTGWAVNKYDAIYAVLSCAIYKNCKTLMERGATHITQDMLDALHPDNVDGWAYIVSDKWKGKITVEEYREWLGRK